MISSYDQPSKTEQIARSRARRRRAARPMRICVPGGIWVYDFIVQLLRSCQQAFAIHQLCVENRGAGCPSNRVVAKDPEFVIEDGTWADRPNDNAHALCAIAIQPRLRPLNVTL